VCATNKLAKRIVALHAFIKKSVQTPNRELKLARNRQKELKDD
jgi:phage-related protein